MKIKSVENEIFSKSSANDADSDVERHGYTMYRILNDSLRYFRIKGKEVLIDFEKVLMYKCESCKIISMAEKIDDDVFFKIIGYYNSNKDPQKECYINIVNLVFDNLEKEK